MFDDENPSTPISSEEISCECLSSLSRDKLQKITKIFQTKGIKALPQNKTKPVLIVNLRDAIREHGIVNEEPFALDDALKIPLNKLNNWQIQEILLDFKGKVQHEDALINEFKNVTEQQILGMNKQKLKSTYMKCIATLNDEKYSVHAEYETDKKKWKLDIAETRMISSLVSIIFGVFVQVILLLPTLSFFELPLYGSIPLVVIADVVSFIAFHFEHIDARFHCFIKDKDHEDHTIFNWKRFPETFPSTSRMSLLLYIVSIALNISSLIVENNILLLFALGFSLLTRLSTDIIDVLFLK
jgi:hypothetical protein